MKTKTIILEIRAAEGGQDSKLLVEDISNIYIKSARNNNFEYKVTEQRSGLCIIWLTGNGVDKYYQNESGCHRWIRIPPTERKGRTQTSIISVALTYPEQFEFKLDKSTVRRQYVRSGGKGGQHVNKVSTCVQLTDEKTGIQVKVQDTRTQKGNEEIAWKRLEDKIKSIHYEKHFEKMEGNRFDQIGYANRSDKKRTYRIKDDIVVDHESGKSCSFKDFSRGKIELLA